MNEVLIIVLEPTRQLSAKERREFERVVGQNPHFLPGYADALTRLAIAYAGYKKAEHEVRKRPTITVQKFNRSTGNVAGTVEKRNTAAFANLNAFAKQIAALERNLLSGPTYDARRQAMLTKRARAAQGAEQAEAEEPAIENAIIGPISLSTPDGEQNTYGLHDDDVIDSSSALNPAQTAAERRLPIDTPPPAPMHRQLVPCSCRLTSSRRPPGPSLPVHSPAAKLPPFPP